MARVPITIYKKSVLATILGLIGTVFQLLGAISAATLVLSLIKEGMKAGFASMLLMVLLCLGAGLGLQALAARIHEKKQFRLWVRKVREAGLESQIAASTQTALQVFKTNPTKRTIAYLAGLNPAAGELLAQAAEKQQKTPKKGASSGR